VLLDFARVTELSPEVDARGVRRRDRGRGALLGLALGFEPRDLRGGFALALRARRRRFKKRAKDGERESGESGRRAKDAARRARRTFSW